MKIITREKYTKVVLKTPAIGSVGDKTDRSLAEECDIDFILHKYGDAIAGQRWKAGEVDDFSDVPDDPVDRLEWLKQNKELSERAGIGSRGEIIDKDKFNAFFGLSESKKVEDTLKEDYENLKRQFEDYKQANPVQVQPEEKQELN